MKLDLHVTTVDGDDYTVQTNLFVIVAAVQNPVNATEFTVTTGLER